MKNPIIIALDFQTKQDVRSFLKQFGDESLHVKVGMELFYKEGPSIISLLKDAGHHIFLDLKLHDIPNTVKQAMKSLARLDVDMVNVHAAGGKKMMTAALEGLEAGTPVGKERPLLIGVTQLTSTSQEMVQEELLIQGELDNVVLHYANLCKESGLDGVVCSALEVPLLKENLSSSFLTVTPGIRLVKNQNDDQVRVTTPFDANQKGTDMIVVGRSITKADHPLEAYRIVQKNWEGQA